MEQTEAVKTLKEKIRNGFYINAADVALAAPLGTKYRATFKIGMLSPHELVWEESYQIIIQEIQEELADSLKMFPQVDSIVIHIYALFPGEREEMHIQSFKWGMWWNGLFSSKVINYKEAK